MKTQMPTSLEIAQQATLRPIADVAADAGLLPEEIETYGRYKAKVDLSVIDRLSDRADAKLINVTAVTPTPAGEGKTTTSVSLTEGLGVLGRSPVLCLREASLGPVFGVKGGAAGGGYAQVVPMEDLNLHFTGDLHAITAANNLLAAMIDAHILHGNELGLDPLSISWRRCLDMNDRSLRDVVTGLGGRANGYPRQTGFDITAASEIMALVAVARDLADLRKRLGAITIGQTYDGEPVTAEQIRAAGALAVILKEAIKPNLVQTLEGQPAFVHCGPFANIAHGNNSLVADRVALKLGDYIDHRVRLRVGHGHGEVLRHHVPDGRPAARRRRARGDGARAEAPCRRSPTAGCAAIEIGAQNIARHIGIVKGFGLQAVVAVNRFPTDTDEELELVRKLALEARRLRGRGERGVRARRRGRDRARRGGDRRRRPAVELRLRLPARGADRGEDPRDRDEGLRRRRHRAAPGREAEGGGVRGGGAREPPDLHGEDAPLALARPRAQERADRVHGARCATCGRTRAPAGSSRSAAT